MGVLLHYSYPINKNGWKSNHCTLISLSNGLMKGDPLIVWVFIIWSSRRAWISSTEDRIWIPVSRYAFVMKDTESQVSIMVCIAFSKENSYLKRKWLSLVTELFFSNSLIQYIILSSWINYFALAAQISYLLLLFLSMSFSCTQKTAHLENTNDVTWDTNAYTHH